MTVTNQASSTKGLGNGLTTTFDYGFLIPFLSDGTTPAVLVTYTDTLGNTTTLVPPSYSITGVGNPLGGTVIYNPGSPIANGTFLTISRAVPYIQPDTFPNQGFLPESIESGLDNLELQIQQLLSQVTSVVTIPTKLFVTPEMFGAKGDGINNDAPAFTAAFATGLAVMGLATSTYLIGSLVSIPSNAHYLGGGVLKSGGTNYFAASGNNILLENIFVDQNGGLGLIGNTGMNNTLKGGKSFGVCTGYYIAFSGGDNARVLDVLVDASQATAAQAGLLFDVAKNYLVDRVIVYDYTGFGMQFRNTSGTSAKNTGGRVKNCVVLSPVHTESITSVGQTVFNFTLDAACGRPGIQINGVPKTTANVSGGFAITTGDNIHFTVTFGSSQAAATVVKLFAWRGLEPMNVNSLVQDLVIEGCVLDGGGDGGVVFGDDYVLGSPNNCVVTNNVIKNCASSGISEDSAACTNNTFTDNAIRDCCLTTDDAFFASGIAWQGNAVNIGGGSIRNTGAVPTIKYGVTCNGAGAADVGAVNKSCSLSPIAFDSTLVHGWNLVQESTSVLFGNINLIASPLYNYPGDPMVDIIAAWGSGGPPTVGVPTTTAWLAYTASIGSGWTRQTAGTLNGTACIQTIAAAEGLITFPANALLASSVFEFTFWAKANSGASYVEVFAQVSASFPFITVPITSTSWTQFRVTVPLVGTSRLYEIRIGSSSGTALIDGLRFGYRPYG